MTRNQNTFSPEMVATINAAYERAVERLDLHSAHSDSRARLAKLIMDAAQDGETDETQLSEAGIAGVRRGEVLQARAQAVRQA